MKNHNLLLLITATLLTGCSTTPDEPDLNSTLPTLSLQTLLPTAAPNDYCNSTMDSDILYGTGQFLYDAKIYALAESCLIMAAPKHKRALCYLSSMAEQDQSKPESERNTKAFNYMAYSASNNDSCAAYGMYQTYLYGQRGQERDETLALRWLERSAKLGDPEAQRTLAFRYEEKGDLAASYAWTKIFNNNADTTDFLKSLMPPKQISAGEKLYSTLEKTVTSKKSVLEQGLKNEAMIFSADIYRAAPSTFNGVNTEERQNFVKTTIATAREHAKLKSRGSVVNYIIVAWHAKQKLPATKILDNEEVVKKLNNIDQGIDDTVSQVLDILEKA